jgi:thioredoxin-like negative regulator of GroEL
VARHRLAIAALAIGVAGCGGSDAGERSASPAPATATGQVLTADDASFERVVEEADQPVLVLFWAPWSGPDRVVMPYLGRAARERPGLRVVKVDVDRAPEVAQRDDVVAIPTAMVLRDGEQSGKRVTGALPRKRWEAQLGLDALE